MKRNVKSLNMMVLDSLASESMPFVTTEFSTLNEKFSVGIATPPSNQNYPTIKYLAIGRGGATATVIDNGLSIDYLVHSLEDSCLFEHIPFALRPVTNDLSANDRAKYRLRKLLTIGGIDYFAYYLKVIPNLPTVVEINVLTMADGSLVSSVPYVPTSNRLNPTPVDLSNTLLSLSDGKHISTQVTLNVTLDNAEIANIISACEIIYGRTGLAVISEVAPVAGFDYAASSNDGGQTVNYTEVRCAQVMGFLSTCRDLEEQNTLPISFKLSEENPNPPTTGN
jgi:hypothetical protein